MSDETKPPAVPPPARGEGGTCRCHCMRFIGYDDDKFVACPACHHEKHTGICTVPTCAPVRAPTPSSAPPTPGAGREGRLVGASEQSKTPCSHCGKTDWLRFWQDKLGGGICDSCVSLMHDMMPAAPPQSAGAPTAAEFCDCGDVNEPDWRAHPISCRLQTEIRVRWASRDVAEELKRRAVQPPPTEPALGEAELRDVIEVLWTMTDFVEALMPLAKMKRTPPWDLEIKNAREVLQRLRKRAAAPRPEGAK